MIHTILIVLLSPVAFAQSTLTRQQINLIPKQDVSDTGRLRFDHSRNFANTQVGDNVGEIEWRSMISGSRTVRAEIFGSHVAGDDINIFVYAGDNTVSTMFGRNSVEIYKLLVPVGSQSLGTSSQRWTNSFFRFVSVSDASGDGLISTLNPSVDNLYSLGSASYRYSNVHAYNLGSSSARLQNAFFNNITISNSSAGQGVTGHLIPNANVSHDIGNDTIPARWRTVYAANLNLTGTCTGCIITPPVSWHLDNTSDILTLGTHVDSNAAQQLVTQFSRGTTAAPASVQNGDQALQMTFTYYAGGAYRDHAAIFTHVNDSAPSSVSWGATMSFYTSDACTVSCGGTPPSEKLRIGSPITTFAHIYPNTTATHTLGSSTQEWAFVFARQLYSSTTLTVNVNNSPEWILSDTSMNPVSDGGNGLGIESLQLDHVYSRTFRATTYSGYGVQDHTMTADQNSLNMNLYAYGSSGASVPRAGYHMYLSGGTIASPGNVVNGSRIGTIAWHGRAGGQFNASAIIEAWINGTISGTIVPTELRFRTMNASGTLADRLIIAPSGDATFAHNLTASVVNATGSPAYRVGGQTVIDSSRNMTTGNINPIADVSYNIGSSSSQYNIGYAATWEASTALLVIVNGITRFIASGGGINLRNASDTLTFSIASTSGLADSATGYAVGGSSGTTNNLSCGTGQAVKAINVSGGIVLSVSCGVP